MMFWMKKNLMLTGAALAAFFMALAKAFTLGKKSEQQKQIEKTLKAATTRLEVENEVNKKLMLMCVLLSLTGCVTHKYASFCVGWLPIYLDKRDVEVISSNLAREILKHNKQGERLCGWGYDKKKS